MFQGDWGSDILDNMAGNKDQCTEVIGVLNFCVWPDSWFHVSINKTLDDYSFNFPKREDAQPFLLDLYNYNTNKI